jgi:hypothetical protein
MLGVSLGPVTGKLVAQLVAGERPALDLAPLDPDRFGRDARRRSARASGAAVRERAPACRHAPASRARERRRRALATPRQAVAMTASASTSTRAPSRTSWSTRTRVEAEYLLAVKYWARTSWISRSEAAGRSGGDPCDGASVARSHGRTEAVFYHGRQPFLHLHWHVGGRPITAAARRALLRELRLRYRERMIVAAPVSRRRRPRDPGDGRVRLGGR